MKEQVRFWDVIGLVMVSLAVFTGTYAAGQWVLQDFPNSADEVDYLYMAQTFAQGRVSNPPHPMHDVIAPLYVVSHEGRAFAIFPPGWPLVLAGGVLAGAPEVVNPLLSALTVPLLFALGWFHRGRRTAWLAVLFLTLSPFFLMNGGSYFSHPACHFWVLLSTLCLMLAQRHGALTWALAAGGGAALAFATRELTAVALLLPPMGYVLYKSPRRFSAAALMGLGALPLLLGYGAYNAALTGDWFQPVRALLGSELYGFGTRTIHVFDYVERQYFGPDDALRHLFNNMGRLLAWSFAGLPLLAVLSLWHNRRDSWTRVYTASIGLLLLGYFFYSTEGGNQYGPRFYFEALGFLSLLGAAAVEPGWRLWGGGKNLKKIVAAALIALSALLFAVHAKNLYQIIYERRTLERLVERRSLNNALIFVGAKSGDMIQGDLIRNPPNWRQAEILYAWDLGPRNAAIMQAFPNRTYYRFGRDDRSGAYYLERMKPPLGQDP